MAKYFVESLKFYRFVRNFDPFRYFRRFYRTSRLLDYHSSGLISTSRTLDHNLVGSTTFRSSENGAKARLLHSFLGPFQWSDSIFSTVRFHRHQPRSTKETSDHSVTSSLDFLTGLPVHLNPQKGSSTVSQCQFQTFLPVQKHLTTFQKILGIRPPF